MRRHAAIIATLVVSLGHLGNAGAHQLDEYLQATTLVLTRDRVRVTLHLTPGARIAETILPQIDVYGDGEISEREEIAYGERVRADLALSVDGAPRSLDIASEDVSECRRYARRHG